MKTVNREIQLINQDLIETLLNGAEESPRRRINHNFHPSLADNPHRFLNVMLRDSYFTPHRHLNPPKSETFVVLAGTLAFFIFNEDGSIQACHILGDDSLNRGIDIAPGLWHCLAVLSETCVCFEVKPGPYEQQTDKEFAPWAPQEGDQACAAYLQQLKDFAAQNTERQDS